MIVCVCHGVSDRAIDGMIQEGCRSMRQVARRCQAGTDCGACRDSIKQMIHESNSASMSRTANGLIPAVSVV